MYLDYPDTIGFQGKMNIEFLRWVLYKSHVRIYQDQQIHTYSVRHFLKFSLQKHIRDHFVHALSQGEMTLL